MEWTSSINFPWVLRDQDYMCLFVLKYFDFIMYQDN